MMSKPTLKDRQTRELFRNYVRSVALGEVGYVEEPKGSNNTKFGRWFGLNPAQWCAMYVSWVYDQAAFRVGCENPLAGLQTKRGFAKCTVTFPRAKQWGIVLGDTEPVLTGDVVIWSKRRFPWIGANGHTGIVTHVHEDGSFDVTEGNTDGGFSRTGGTVMTHNHRRGDGKHGYLKAIYRPTRRFHNPRKK